MIAFYPDDWVLLFYDAPLDMSSPVTNDCKFHTTITRQAPLLCPRSLYEESLRPEGQRPRWSEFLRTGKIPRDCPELRRIALIQMDG